MSTQAPPRPQPGPGGSPFGGGPGSLGMRLPAEKARDFRGSLGRLMHRLRPDRFVIAVVLVLAVISVFFAVLGPRLLGQATNVVFAGIVGAQLPPGTTQQQAIEQLRAAGETTQADMLASMTLTDGVDFTLLAQIIALTVVVYFISSVFSWGQNYLMAGVTQRAMFRLREEVDVKRKSTCSASASC